MQDNPNVTVNQPKLNTVQALRALAAVMVAIAHAAEEAKYFFSLNTVVDSTPLGKGVDLFFVISGFIIYYSSRNHLGSADGLRRFAYNRFIRVVPLYFLFTTLMVAVVVLLPSGVKEAKFDIGQIITSYLFIPYERYDGRIAPILSLGWTLNYEIFFYAIFAAVMMTGKRWAPILTVGILFLLAFIGAFMPDSAPAPLRAWTFNIILEFAMGIAIALLYEKYGKSLARGYLLPVALIALGLALLYVLNLPDPIVDLPRFLSAGVPAMIVGSAAVLLLPEEAERRMPRGVSALGDSSYSLYLSHRFIQRPIQIVLTRAALPDPLTGWLYMLLAVPAAIIFSLFVFRYLETPLLQRFRWKSATETKQDTQLPRAAATAGD